MHTTELGGTVPVASSNANSRVGDVFSSLHLPRVLVIAGSVTAVATAGLLAASCATDGADVTSSPSVSAVSPSPSLSPSAIPSSSVVPGEEASPSATSDGAQGHDNDPEDGVARDVPVPAPSQTTSDGRAEVSVVLTRWSASRPFEAGGLITNITEEGGACTLTVTRGQTSLSATGSGAAGPSGVSCGDGLRIDDAALTPGTWAVSLSYSSSKYVGTSAPQEVTLS